MINYTAYNQLKGFNKSKDIARTREEDPMKH